MNLSESRTLENLMRAFAGECQARSRYDFAAGAAKNEKLPVLQRVFVYTAGQEYEHAGLFLKQIRAAGMQNVNIAGGYPVDLKTDCLSLLRAAQHNEMEERHIVYPDFARDARDEGFSQIAALFDGVARIEESHAARFALLANWMEAGMLFSGGGASESWLCLNCGHVLEGPDAPARCPICAHEQGYFIRAAYAPFAAGN